MPLSLQGCFLLHTINPGQRRSLRHPQPAQGVQQGWGHQIFIRAPKSRLGGDWVSELSSSPLAALCAPGTWPRADK